MEGLAPSIIRGGQVLGRRIDCSVIMNVAKRHANVQECNPHLVKYHELGEYVLIQT
jgi:hypothetical protein